MSTIAELRPTDPSLEVTWSDGVVTRYPWLWLRDHSHDEGTLLRASMQRQLFTAGLPRDMRGLDVKVVDGDLLVKWDVFDVDSVLPVAFLAEHRHPRAARATVDVPVTLWNAASLTTPTVEYDAVMADDEGVALWLSRLLQYGFCIVTGTPATGAATEALLRRVAYIRDTIFGAFWEFEADMAKADTAYSTLELRGHTDSTYSHDAPGAQLLHCLRFKGTGGESTIVDGFAIARRIPSSVHYQDQRTWGQMDYWVRPLMPTELSGMTLGLVGFGQIGQEMATRCRALGMRIVEHPRRSAVVSTRSTICASNSTGSKPICPTMFSICAVTALPPQ